MTIVVVGTIVLLRASKVTMFTPASETFCGLLTVDIYGRTAGNCSTALGLSTICVTRPLKRCYRDRKGREFAAISGSVPDTGRLWLLNRKVRDICLSFALRV